MTQEEGEGGGGRGEGIEKEDEDDDDAIDSIELAIRKIGLLDSSFDFYANRSNSRCIDRFQVQTVEEEEEEEEILVALVLGLMFGESYWCSETFFYTFLFSFLKFFFIRVLLIGTALLVQSTHSHTRTFLFE